MDQGLWLGANAADQQGFAHPRYRLSDPGGGAGRSRQSLSAATAKARRGFAGRRDAAGVARADIQAWKQAHPGMEGQGA